MGFIFYIVKYTLLIVNLLFAILGMSLIVLGLVGHFGFKQSNLEDHVHEWIFLIFMIIIGIGTIVLIISFTACYGVLGKSKVYLVMFAVFMLTLAAAKIGFVIVVNRNIEEIQKAAATAVNQIAIPTSENPKDNYIHYVEYIMQCCGTTGPDSYIHSLTPPALPPTCCKNDNPSYMIEKLEATCLASNAYDVGCLEAVELSIRKIWDISMIVAISIIVFEAVEFAAAAYLFATIKKKKF